MSNYELISTKEAAARLGVSRQRVEQLITNGSIEAIKIPIPGSKRHHIHIDAASVEARRREARAGRIHSGRRTTPKASPVQSVADKVAAIEPIVVADPPKRRRRKMRRSPAGWMTVAQAAKHLNVTPSTLRRYVYTGLLKGYYWTDESGRQTGRAKIMVIREAEVQTFVKPTRSYDHLRTSPRPTPAVTPVKAEPTPEPARRGFWARLLGRS